MKVDLREEPAREQLPLAEPDFARWRSVDGEVVTTFHRTAKGYLVRFLDRADFAVEPDNGIVTCRRAPGASANVTKDLFLNQVLPMIRGHGGELVIHASAVAIGGGVVGFVGSTGQGKSTLAAAFARAGMPFLSDDGVYLVADGERYLAGPNRPSFRLWQDSEAAVIRGDAVPDECDEEKSRIEASEALPFQNEPLPLRALYFLGSGEELQPVIADLPAPQALAQLINHSFFLDAGDRERMAGHFEALGKLAETVPGYTLDYPREFDRLPCVIEAVSRHQASRRGIL